MSTRSVARRYARALFELEQEGANIRTPLRSVAEVVAVEDIRTLLAASQVPAADKAAVIEKVAGSLPKEISRLVHMLCERNKAELLPDIAGLVESMIQQAASEVEADVVAAVKLDTAARNKIAEALGTAVSRKVNLNVRHDASILGGLVVQIGDRQLDYSLRTRLQDLKRAMVS